MPAFSQGTETSSRGKTVHQASSENWNGQGGWQANRPPVQKGPEAGMSLPASARQPGRSRSQPFCFGFWHFWSGAFCRNMHIVGLLPKEVTDSLTQQLEERGGVGNYFVFYKFFFKARINPTAIFCGTLASNLYQESLCLHEMTIWYCIWYKTIFLLPGFTLQHIVYCTAEWFGGLSHGNRRHSPKPTWSQVNENPALNKIRQHFYTQKQLETKEIPLLV